MTTDRFPDHWPEGLRQVFRDLEARPPKDLAEAQRFLSRRMAEYNDTPQAELGDVSPVQAHAILTDPWDGTGPLRISEDLPHAAFAAEDALMVLHAQHLLAFALREGPIGLTPAGFLPRKVVACLLDAMPWRPGYIAELWEMNKVVNEADVPPILDVRGLLLALKLLTDTRGSLRVTRRGRAFADRAHTGALAARLFRAVFRETDFLALGRRAGEPDITGHIPLMLRRLSRLDEAWRDAGTMTIAITTQELRDAWPKPAPGAAVPWVPDVTFVVEHTVLRPLADFGLIAIEGGPGPLSPRRYRRTALVPHFLRWSFDTT